MKTPNPTLCVYDFAPFRLSPGERLLLREESPVSLPPKVFDTLVALVERSGHLIEKDEFFAKVWPDTFVGDATLARNIFLLRNTLGSGFIQTVPKRGYRFIADVKMLESGVSATRHAAPPSSSDQRPMAQPRSIAVLPFKSFIVDDTHEYLGLGMADALITRLSNIRRVTVRSTSSVVKYTELAADPIAAGRELGVDAILDGRIQRTGDRLRLTVQLVSVCDGVPLWAGKFDEKYTDIFSVQDAISRRVAAELALKLTIEERKLLTKRHTQNVEAYQAYLRGRYFWNRRARRWFHKSLQCFEEAIELDPYFALAHAGRGDALTLMCGWEAVSPKDALPKAKASFRIALEIDPTLSEAHAGLGHALLHSWDWEEAESAFNKAIDLNPGYASAHQWYSEYLAANGRFDEAIEESLTAAQLEPMSLLMSADVGWTLYQAGRYDEAAERLAQLTELDPDYWYPHYFLGLVYTQKHMYSEALEELQKAMDLSGRGPLSPLLIGRTYAAAGRAEEARQIIEKLVSISGQRFFSPSRLAPIYAALGDKNQAFEWLERAYELGDVHLILLKVDPALEPLRDDPRFDSLVRRLGLQA